jgi:hypothetical protein
MINYHKMDRVTELKVMHTIPLTQCFNFLKFFTIEMTNLNLLFTVTQACHHFMRQPGQTQKFIECESPPGPDPSITSLSHNNITILLPDISLDSALKYWRTFNFQIMFQRCANIGAPLIFKLCFRDAPTLMAQGDSVRH